MSTTSSEVGFYAAIIVWFIVYAIYDGDAALNDYQRGKRDAIDSISYSIKDTLNNKPRLTDKWQ